MKPTALPELSQVIAIAGREGAAAQHLRGAAIGDLSGSLAAVGLVLQDANGIETAGRCNGKLADVIFMKQYWLADRSEPAG
jgi:hypothetical protein